MQYQDVIKFWFQELSTEQWFKKDANLDNKINEKFSNLHLAARQGELYGWRDSALGCLAEVIVLDQFSRNMFRDTPQAFAYDPTALVIAQECVRTGRDRELSIKEKAFLYMPYMHSESALIHEQAVKLFSQPGLEFNLDFEFKHKVIIDRFGRYPHRNIILGRQSTAEEVEFLKQPGSSF